MGLMQDHHSLQSGHMTNIIKQLETTIEHMRIKTKMSEERIQKFLAILKESALQMITN